MSRQISIDLVGRDMLSKSLAVAAEATKALKRSLDELDRKRVTVDVDADTAGAREQLRAAKAEADKVDGKKATVKVDADTGGALSALRMVGMALAGLAAIPVGATVGAGVLAMVPAFAAAGIGAAGLAAVAVPAFGEIKAALQAQTQAQAQSGAAAVAAQSKALAMAGAQQQVASAVRQAAYAHVQALQQVQQAQQSLTQSEQGAATAERDLVQARKDAAAQLQQTANNAVDAKLAERQASFDAADAQTAYNAVVANPASTKDQIARAKLVLDQAKQNLKERHQAAVQAAADETSAAKAGVDGSAAVVAARQKLAQADQQVTDAERALADARASVARTDQQSADSVTSARRGLTAASLQGAGASNALQAAMAKLSPSARSLMGHWTGLKGAFDGWRKSMEPTVLPIFGRALDVLKGQIPSLTPIVKGAAGVLSGLVGDIAKGAKSPFWAQFKGQLTALVPKSLGTVKKVAEDVAVAVLHIIKAFLPYAPGLLTWIGKIADRFATWGKGLGSGNQVGKFMDYVKTQGPKIWEIVQNIAKAAAHVVSALSGGGGSSLSSIQLISKALAGLSPGQIQAVAAGFLAWKGAMAGVQGVKSLGEFGDKIKDAKDQITGFADGTKKAWKGISSGAAGTAQMLGRVRDGFKDSQAAESAFSGKAGSLGGLLRKGLDGAGAGWSKLISGAKGAGGAVSAARGKILDAGKAAASAALDLGKLAAGYVLSGLKAAWSAIQFIAVKIAQLAVSAATKAWAAIQWILDAALDANPIGLVVIAIAALVAGVIYAYTHFKWFKNAVDAAWRGIVAASVWAWNTIIKPIWSAIKWYIGSILIPYFKLMWDAVKKVWSWISAAISLAWNTIIKPIFNLIKWYVVNVVIAYFKLLWSAVKLVWNGLSGSISWVWDNGIKPVFTAIKTAVGAVQTAFRIAVDGIRKIWDGLRSATRGPVAFVVNTIYQNGIRKVWEGVREVVPGLHALPSVKFAAGGVFPGYTPGRDVHRVPMAAFSGGEGVIRPEATKTLGEKWIHGINRASKGGTRAVEKFLLGVGDPGAVVAGYADGGILGSITGMLKKPLDFAAHAGSLLLSKGADWVAKGVLSPLLGRLADATGTSPWGHSAAGLGREGINGFLGFIHKIVSPNLGGGGSAKAVAAARSMIGTPYSWGGGGIGGPSYGIAQGAGINGFDCSSFMEWAWWQAAHKDITRTTFSQRRFLKPIANPVPGAIGQPNPDHTYMYAGNGRILEEPHTGAVARETSVRGGEWWGMPPWTADSGGWLQPHSVTAIHNGSNKPEALVPGDLMPAGHGGGLIQVVLEVDGKRVADVIFEPLKGKIRRVSGGDVQKALGQN